MNSIRLNKYISNSGYCSRRNADDFILSGFVFVNENLIIKPGHIIDITDSVIIKGKLLSKPSLNYQYILLNKPLDYITTSKDPYNRKIVLDLINLPTNDRIYSVGRLDINTTGALLLTNDGDLAHKLSHPSFEIEKLYSITLNKSLINSHIESLLTGIILTDGMFRFDSISFPYPSNHKTINLKLHSGKNRIIRRAFSSLKYKIIFLNRTSFAGLSINNLLVGQWRNLVTSEILYLNKITS